MLAIKAVKQSEGHCGPASLQMVLGYLGIEKTEKEIAALAGTSVENGTGAEGLVKAAEALGRTAIIKDFATVEDIQEYVVNQKIPVIVDWFSHDDGHYSVVSDIDVSKGEITIVDPEIGDTVTMSIKDFKRVWFDFPGNELVSKEDIIIKRIIVIS